MRVYRVEHTFGGHGPYIIPASVRDWHEEDYWQLAELSDELCMAHADEDTHPTPHPVSFRMVCAFETLDDLHEWFYGFESDLERLGYVIAVYEVDEVLQRNGQVMFNKKYADPLTHLDFSGKIVA